MFSAQRLSLPAGGAVACWVPTSTSLLHSRERRRRYRKRGDNVNVFRPLPGKTERLLCVSDAVWCGSHWVHGRSYFCPGVCALCEAFRRRELLSVVVARAVSKRRCLAELNLDGFNGLDEGRRVKAGVVLEVTTSTDRHAAWRFVVLENRDLAAEAVVPLTVVWGEIARLFGMPFDSSIGLQEAVQRLRDVAIKRSVVAAEGASGLFA